MAPKGHRPAMKRPARHVPAVAEHPLVPQVTLQKKAASHARKRPASHTPEHEPAQYQAAPADQAPPTNDWLQEYVPQDQAQSPCFPEWERVAVETLMAAGLLHRQDGSTNEMVLRVWSDCAGLATEMYSLNALRGALAKIGIKVKFVLYMYCERDPRAIEFAKANHQPSHISDNIESRNLEEGKIWCSKCQQNHDLPTEGIDIYVAGYPCSPWSRRGTRTGFQHKDIKPFQIGIPTINIIRPVIWLWETAEGVADQRASQDCTDLDRAKAYIAKHISTPYASVEVKCMSPPQQGFPNRRSRRYALNVRADIRGATKLGPAISALLAAPVQLRHNYWTFLNLARKVDWSKVGQYPSAA